MTDKRNELINSMNAIKMQSLNRAAMRSRPHSKLPTVAMKPTAPGVIRRIPRSMIAPKPSTVAIQELTRGADGIKTIGCMLTYHRRPQNFARQVDAVLGQSIPASQIMVWHNAEPGIPPPDLSRIPDAVCISASKNMGVWPRFMACFEFTTDYVCVFDDDTIPGNRWFENCVTTMYTHRGLLGTIGVINFSAGREAGHTRVGWSAPNVDVAEADLVGHSWFFERDWLRYYGAEPRCGCTTCGEDYHFSVALQKQAGIKTYVPPHPPTDKSLWGSLEAASLGSDSVALWKAKGEHEKKIIMHDKYLASGWQLMIQRYGKV